MILVLYPLISLTGGNYSSITIGVTSYISDTTKPSTRTSRLALNRSLQTAAHLTGVVMGGLLADYVDSRFICLWCFLSYILLFLYCSLLPADPTPSEKSGVYHSVQSNKARECYLIQLSVFSRLAVTAPSGILVVFLLGSPFFLPAHLIGVFLGYKGFCVALTCLLFYLLPSRFHCDVKMSATGLLLLSLSYITLSLSRSLALIFLGATLHGLHGVMTVSTDSLLTKGVPEDRLAGTMALINSTERLLLILVTIGMSLVYQGTKTYFLGACFYLPLVLCGVTGCRYKIECWIFSLPGLMPSASTRMPFCFAKRHSRVRIRKRHFGILTNR
eukprot:sb/3466666/